MIATSDGGFLLGGFSFSGQVGDENYWVVKISANGTKQWDKTFGPSNYNRLKSMVATSDGGFLLGGDSDSQQGGDKSENAKGLDDYWVVKINANGTKQWDKTFGGSNWDYLNSMVATPDGGFLLGGYSYSDQGGDKSENAKGSPDYWVVKISANGTKQWDKTLGGSGYNVLKSMIATSDGGFLLGGFSYSDQGGDKSENAKGWEDYWVIKIK